MLNLLGPHYSDMVRTGFFIDTTTRIVNKAVLVFHHAFFSRDKTKLAPTNQTLTDCKLHLTHTKINTHYNITQVVMAEKLTRLTQQIMMLQQKAVFLTSAGPRSEFKNFWIYPVTLLNFF
jgi:hypothetical protein